MGGNFFKNYNFGLTKIKKVEKNIKKTKKSPALRKKQNLIGLKKPRNKINKRILTKIKKSLLLNDLIYQKYKKKTVKDNKKLKFYRKAFTNINSKKAFLYPSLALNEFT